MICHLSLGSNLGDRLANLRQALDQIERRGSRIRICSSVYETQPVGVTDQPDFLNLVVEAETLFSAHQLLQSCKALEQELGRVRADRFGPRLIDVDLLLLENSVFESPGLTVPHPRMHLRKFVLVPLCEIAPEVIHPRFSLTALQLLASTPDSSRVERYCGRLI